MTQEKITLQERFKYMREEKINLSQQKLADRLNIKQQTIANIESGRKQKIDTDILYKLSEEFAINSEWLMFGTGNIDKVDDEEEYLHKYYNDKVAAIRKYDFNLSEEENRNRQEKDDKNILFFDKRWLRNILGVNPDNLFFIYAPDDSMNSGKNTINDIKKNDILFLDISQKQGNNNIFVYKNDFDNQPTIRQIKWSLSENIKLIPANPKYKEEIVDKNANEFIVVIVGRIVVNISTLHIF